MNFKRRGRSVKSSSYSLFSTNEKWGRKHSRATTSSNDSDDETEQENTAEPEEKVTDWMEEFFGRPSLDSTDDQDDDAHVNIRQTMILATLLPDELLGLKNLQTPQTQRFIGVLLMADVSGYTALSEKYNTLGESGTYRLTATLNAYIGALAELIYSYGGDIIKFAGDAFLALFKTDRKTFLYHTIHNVIACALVIQHSYGDYETDVKVNLRVKLAISAGNLTFVTIGTSSDMNYVIIGLPVLEAKAAEAVCQSGTVTLTPTAWAHCYSRNYIYNIREDGHVNIIAILYDPREKDVNKPFAGIASLVKHNKKPFTNEEQLNDMLKVTFSREDLSKNRFAFAMRKNITRAVDTNVGKSIRNFMIRPVLTQVYAHQPIEYLTEMRQVSVLFLTFKPKECPVNQLITLVDNAYCITSAIVYKSLGCVNKIILFDKDVMILVIFGLRGFKHESEAQAALKCACSIRKAIADLDGVLRASIGITTGVVYCGVVGHPLRREFTVIGAVVNKAARLMCHFYNKVTCDENTFIKSKMSSNGFTLMPVTALKGIQNPGNIYEYNDQIRSKEVNNLTVIPCLLGRTEETDFFSKWLLSRQNYDSIILIGEARIGKSRLLQWFKRCGSRQGYKVCCVRLSIIHASTSYLALSQIVEHVLDVSENISNNFQKEEKIVELLGSCDPNLCYLNKIIKVRFPYHEAVNSTTKEKRIVIAKEYFVKIFRAIEGNYLIILDDLQNLDIASWEFIEEILPLKIFAIVMSLTRAKLSPAHSWVARILNNNRIYKMLIGPLSNDWIPSLACQILDVNAVPTDLCDTLQTKCRGMPGNIENYLLHLYLNGALDIVQVTTEDLGEHKDEMLIFPEQQHLQLLAFHSKDQEMVTDYFKSLEELEPNDKKICVVTDKSLLMENLSAQNYEAIIMMQIDLLTPYQQLLLKIASVIGNSLSRDLLENIMYENNEMITAKAIKKLFEANILGCAHVTKHSNHCECNFAYDPDNILPKYAYCKVLKFRSKSSRNSCYELLPLNQKKEFHTRIVNFLELSGRQKCVDCGGNLTIVQSKVTLDLPNFAESNEVQSRILRPIAGSTSQSNDNSTAQYLDEIEISGNLKHTPILKSSQSSDNIICRRSTKRVTILEESRFYGPNDLPESQILGDFRTVVDAKCLQDWHNLGVKDSRDEITSDSKLSTRDKFICIPIKKGVSQINFNRCSCEELNINIYNQLAYHATKADMKRKALNFLLVYCYLALRCNNDYEALPKLEEAEELAKQLKHELKKTEFRQILGRIYTLKSYAFLLPGNTNATKVNITQAAEAYRIGFNKVSDAINIFRKVKGNILIDIIFFYNVATVYYITQGDERTAKKCSNFSLHLVTKVKSHVPDLLDSFSNAFQVDIDRGSTDSSVGTEKMLRDTIKKMENPLESDELQSIGKLYMTIFQAQLCRGDLVAAIRTGYQACSVSLFLNCKLIFIDIATELFYALLSRARIFECVALLKAILRCKRTNYDDDEPINHDSDTWYYALCMDALLDGGFQVEPPLEINRYGEDILKRGSKASDSSKFRLYTNLWVYWLRINHDNYKIYEEEVLYYFKSKAVGESLNGLLTGIRYAEGMLESLSKKIDDLKKVVHVMELRSVAERELSELEKDSEMMRCLHPRWIRLKGHCYSLCGHKNAAKQKYNQAADLAGNIHNKLEIENIKCINSITNFWVHSARAGNFIAWMHIAEHVGNNWQLFMYNKLHLEKVA